jgi:predicted lysophospholipase L1 biosynthesis ABC-type transport system permease subunit
VTTQGLGVSFDPAADRDAVIARLAEIDPGITATPVPSAVLNLDQIGSTPWLLAGFLGLLGVAGLVHAMATGSTQRDHDLAVGRALGFRPGQAAAGVRWQAVTLAAAGAFVCVVLGVVAGRVVWQRVAHGTGAMVETVLPVWAMLAAPATAIVVALIIAVPSGWRASRHRPSVILRSE